MIQLACALFAALSCASASSDAVRVDGLQEGESYTLLAPGPGPSDEYAHGRVVDAFTGAPLPGATIELWSEEIDEHYGGFHRFGSATSGRDGRFRVRCREGAQRAEKLRASAPGYLVYTEAAGQAREVITLFPAEPTAPRIRFTDLQGRPIEGARVTSTYTCAHDVPAFEYVSDVDGVVVLEGYGLQDAMPELRVLAPGFAGVKYLDADEVYSGLSLSEWDVDLPAEMFCSVRLPRLPGAELRVLDESGAPLTDAELMVLDGDGHHVVRTDGEGNASIPARYDSGELSISRLAPDPGPGAYGFVSATERTTFRLGGDDWPDELAVGRVRFVWSDDASPVDGLQVTHVDGWVDRTDADGWVELPAGAAYVVADDSSLDAPAAMPPVFVIADETALVELPRRQRYAIGTLEAGLVSRVVVEQGSRSTEYALDEDESLELVVGSPEPCTLWYPDLQIRSDHDPETASLSAESPRNLHPLRIGVPTRERPRAAWTFAPPAGVALGLEGPDAHTCTLQADDNLMTVEGPASTPLLLHFTADGCVDLWARALLGDGRNAPAVPELPRLASLRIESEGAILVEGYDELDDLTALHPGPFDCVVRRADGVRIGLRLELEPG
ncbi:MAG: carboxypeptidase regulatory-like domain-containing protein, partial [Planctomycetes bacterium]|nr:carboxypeptidase regulatory-like domain-containing protein [Planctomycetota bacterium]